MAKARKKRKQKTTSKPASAPKRRKRRAQPPRSIADSLALLQQFKSQRALSKELKTSATTLRKILKEGKKPDAKLARKIETRATKRKAALDKENRKRGVPVAIPFKAERQTRIDPFDPKRKRRIPSDTVAVDVSKGDALTMYQTLQKFMRLDPQTSVRFIMSVPENIKRKGSNFRKKAGLVVSDIMTLVDRVKDQKKAVQGSTGWEFAEALARSFEGFADYLQDVQMIGKPVYMVVTNKQKRKGKRK